jgi:hypothetical protein
MKHFKLQFVRLLRPQFDKIAFLKATPSFHIHYLMQTLAHLPDFLYLLFFNACISIYSVCGRVSLWYLQMCLQCALIRIILSIILLHLPPLLRTISTGFVVLFSYMNTKYIHHIHPPPPCPSPPPLPLVPGPIFTFLSFNFKCILTVILYCILIYTHVYITL